MADAKAKVLLCMDGSKYADYAFDWYMKNIAKSGDDVILLHCVEMNFATVMPMGAGGGEVVNRLIDEQKLAAEHYVKKLEELMKDKHLHGKIKQVYGSPRTEILRVAGEECATVIITGTRGMGTVRRTLIGSVSDHVLHHSHVPVLICRHKDDHHMLHQ